MTMRARLVSPTDRLGTTSRVTGTTHISVLDSDGLVAGLSSTLGSGSGVFRHGFQLNNMLGELDVIGAGPRVPGERLASMMAPTLLLEKWPCRGSWSAAQAPSDWPGRSRRSPGT